MNLRYKKDFNCYKLICFLSVNNIFSISLSSPFCFISFRYYMKPVNFKNLKMNY